MTKPKLPKDVKRVKISITLNPATVKLLDGCKTRSEAIEHAILKTYLKR